MGADHGRDAQNPTANEQHARLAIGSWVLGKPFMDAPWAFMAMDGSPKSSKDMPRHSA